MVQKWIEVDDLNFDDPKSDLVLNRLDRFYDQNQCGDGWRSALFKVSDTSLSALITRVDKNDDYKKYFHIPNVYRQLTALKIDRTYFTALILPSELPKRALQDIFPADLLKIGGVVDPRTLDLGIRTSNLPKEVFKIDDKDAVIMAIVDNGIAFGEGHFRTGAVSQVRHCWIMDAEPVGGGVSRGRTFDRTQINTLLGQHLYQDRLDHMAFYEAAGLVDHRRPQFKPVSQRISHGTHVMSLAAGAPANPDLRPIICVELPTDVISDPGSPGLEPEINIALDHVIAQSTRFVLPGGHRPALVINLSYGDYAGPHDGTGYLESSIAEKLEHERNAGRTTRVVLPAGNGHLARCHATMKFPSGVSDHTLHWRLQPDDRTVSSIEIRTPARNKPEITGLLEMRVMPPGGPLSPVIGKQQNQAFFLIENGRILALLVFTIPAPGERGLAALYTVPTASLLDARPLAPHGVWQLHVKRGGKLADGDTAHAWVERGETLPGFPQSGRQAYLDHDDYERFDAAGAPQVMDNGVSLVQRQYTLSGFATNADEDIVTVGACEGRTEKMSDYSASGPSLKRLGQANPVKPGPDVAAVADDSPVLSGIFGAGSYDGSIVRLSGTSVAGPKVAWLIANEIQSGTSPGKGQHIRAKAATDEAGHATSKPPDRLTGDGRLERRRRIGSRV